MTDTPPFTTRTRRLLEEIGWLDDGRAREALQILWSGPDPEGGAERLAAYARAAAPELEVLDDPEATRRIAYLAGASLELCRQLTRHPRWLVDVPEDDPAGKVRATLARVAGDDLAGEIDVAEGGRRLSDMADEVVGQIYDEERGLQTPPMAVIAFGKWGGTELNYWSDIDLSFVYEGTSSDAGPANRAARSIMQRLGNGEEGLVINADAGLRPEGSRGPLARSLAAYRAYYERWAEPWEFQALLKVRPAAGDPEVGADFLEMVGEVLWPETIDPDAIRSLRSLKARVEAGAEPADLKRAPGGIRDIEFAIQMLQLVHGRFDPQLRRTSTLDLIEALTAGDYVALDTARELDRAYRWLRAVEHRLQLWELHQTHVLPRGDLERERLARTMGYRDEPGGSARDQFEADLVSHRSTVRRIHQDLYFRPLLEAFAATPATGLSRAGAERRLTALGFRDVPAAARTFEKLTAGLSRRSRMMQQMLPLIIDWLADSPDPDLGLDQLRLLAADTHDHRELLAALHERPLAGSRLAFLLGSSRLLGQYLDRIPEFLPRLADDRALTQLRRQPELEQRLQRRVDSRPEMADKEGTIRRFARRQILRVAARDLLSLAGVDDTMRDLTDGADAATRVAASLAMTDAPVAVIALGRWGGTELSYGSDLDLLYVYDEPLEADSALGMAVRFRDLLATPARDGMAYELDSGLRPEGRSGALVRSLNAYRAYYERWAQTWELQALVKARPVAGDPAVGRAFMEMIEPFVWRRPFPAEAASEVRRMKARIEKERIPSGEDPDFHLKLGPGGLVDVEFLTQLLQLTRGGEHPPVRVTPTLEALARLGEVGAMAEDEVADLSAAYRFCTHVRNRLFLQSGRRSDSLPTDPTEEWRLAISLGYQHRGDLREDYRRVTRRARRIFTDHFF